MVELAVVVLDAPAPLGHVHEPLQRGICRELRKPVLDRLSMLVQGPDVSPYGLAARGGDAHRPRAAATLLVVQRCRESFARERFRSESIRVKINHQNSMNPNLAIVPAHNEVEAITSTIAAI